MVEQLLPVVILFIFVAIFGAALLFLTSLVGPKLRKNSPDRNRKYMTYECGVEGEESQTTKVPVKFYLTAILFILFDIEIVFMYPWALIFSDTASTMGVFLFFEMLAFLFVVLFGLFYVWRNRGLQWE